MENHHTERISYKNVNWDYSTTGRTPSLQGGVRKLNMVGYTYKLRRYAKAIAKLRHIYQRVYDSQNAIIQKFTTQIISEK